MRKKGVTLLLLLPVVDRNVVFHLSYGWHLRPGVCCYCWARVTLLLCQGRVGAPHYCYPDVHGEWPHYGWAVIIVLTLCTVSGTTPVQVVQEHWFCWWMWKFRFSMGSPLSLWGGLLTSSLLILLRLHPGWGLGHLITACQGWKSWLPHLAFEGVGGDGVQFSLWRSAGVKSLLSKSFLSH